MLALAVPPRVEGGPACWRLRGPAWGARGGGPSDSYSGEQAAGGSPRRARAVPLPRPLLGAVRAVLGQLGVATSCDCEAKGPTQLEVRCPAAARIKWLPCCWFVPGSRGCARPSPSSFGDTSSAEPCCVAQGCTTMRGVPLYFRANAARQSFRTRSKETCSASTATLSSMPVSFISACFAFARPKSVQNPNMRHTASVVSMA
ncbi:hypothetical protein V8C86DRAFT_2465128 [Haematococcus lacustris]